MANSSLPGVISKQTDAGEFEISEESASSLSISTDTPTTVFDAISKQDFTLGEKSGEIDLSGEIVSALAESAVIALVPQEYQDLTASITNLGFSLANAYLLPSLSTAIGVTINPLSAIDMNAMALAQIKNKLEIINKKLDTLLTSEMELAIIKCEKGLFHLKKLLDNANNGTDMKERLANEANKEFR